MDNKITKILIVILIIMVVIFIGIKIVSNSKENNTKHYTYLIRAAEFGDNSETDLVSTKTLFIFDDNNVCLGVRIQWGLKTLEATQEDYKGLKESAVYDVKSDDKTVTFSADSNKGDLKSKIKEDSEVTLTDM